MRDTRAAKILKDIVEERSRSVLVVLAITVGLFAFSSVTDARAILVRELDKNYRRTEPAAAILEMKKSPIPLAAEAAGIVGNVEGVADVSFAGERTARIRTAGGEWHALRLFILPDYALQKIDIVTTVSGSWPPAQNEVLIERAAVAMLGTKGAEETEIRLADGATHRARNAGTVHAPGLAPAWMERTGYAWISEETARSWGILSPMNLIKIRVREPSTDKAHIRDVSSRVRETLAAAGIEVEHVSIPEPGQHPHASQMLTLLYLLETFGYLAMILAAILTASMIRQLMSRQLKQIAIMKAIGGTALQISVMYFGKIAVFAVISCLAALPLANLAAVAYAEFASRMLNFTVFDRTIPHAIYVGEVAAAFAVPLLVAAFPIIRGSRISVREALAETAAVEGKARRGARSRMKGRFSRPLALSLRNTARKPVRLVLTLLTLTAAGAIFITAMNVGSSMDASVISKFRASKYDLRIMLPAFVPDGQIRNTMDSIAEIETFETWGYDRVCVLEDDGKESEYFDLISIPEKTGLQDPPPLVSGRWLTESDTNALVVNQRIEAGGKGLEVGDTIALRVDGKRLVWNVVGVVREVMASPAGYASKGHLDRILERQGTSGILVVRGAAHDRASVQALAGTIDAALAKKGIPVSSCTLLLEFRLAIQEHFVVIASMLTLMALLVVIVGVLGLSSAMGINVLERTRELGILRAIGASRRMVISLIVIEGMAAGFLSWGLAVIVSSPVSAFISQRFGMLFFNAPLEFAISVPGIFVWLVLVLLCSSLASVAPAARVASVPIRETLAWE